MIVSHRHRFVFVKTRKTAGTSIEVALSRFCGDRDVITPLAPEDEAVRSALGYPGPQNCAVPYLRYALPEWVDFVRRHRRARFYNHISASNASAFLGHRVWNSYYKFCFERNPWDRVVSAYFWRKYRTGNAALSFDEFLEQQGPHVLSNYGIYSIDAQPAVDFVGRFENLVPDFHRALRDVGITEAVELPRLKAKARYDKRPYREIITPEQQAYIRGCCEPEIALMGYQFE